MPKLLPNQGYHNQNFQLLLPTAVKIEILLISHASQITEEKENKGLWPDETLDFIFQA